MFLKSWDCKNRQNSQKIGSDQTKSPYTARHAKKVNETFIEGFKITINDGLIF